MFEITQSAEIIVDTTLTAFLVTSTGSIIPDLIILTLLPVTTSTPKPFSGLGSVCSKPAFSNIVLKGAFIASSSISSPTALAEIFCEALSRAIPPPGTIPSCKAALVA